jgi:ribosomal protein S18 acetylase RimI-like enzyme
MSRSASGLPPEYQLEDARTSAQFDAARGLIEEYAAHLRTQMGVDLCFQNLSGELRSLSVMYGAPSGCLWLASRGQEWLGCCALRRFDADVCEMKRLYLRPAARGADLGRRLAESVIRKARVLGYRRLVLDTLEGMTAAQTLYRSLGFREIEPYYFNPMAGVCYMELLLTSSA